MHIEQIVLTADIIIEYEDKSIVLVRRKHYPYKDMWALPGGLMDKGETIEQAAVREAKEETGLDIRLEKLIGVFSRVDRDPRGRYVSVAYVARVTGGEMKAADDAKEIMRTKDYNTLPLAFDHNHILHQYNNM